MLTYGGKTKHLPPHKVFFSPVPERPKIWKARLLGGKLALLHSAAVRSPSPLHLFLPSTWLVGSRSSLTEHGGKVELVER